MAFLSCWTYNFNQDALLLNQKSNVSLTISSSLLIGLCKEYSDSRKPDNQWSWKDIAANLTGIGIGFVLINNLP
ncbi:MAG: hypothetical protein JW996_07435 [Candidatus Cloacimonetes bacterium]|nr:hypothetical protein [Candidatus Cloacimonadota bacterium]